VDAKYLGCKFGHECQNWHSQNPESYCFLNETEHAEFFTYVKGFQNEKYASIAQWRDHLRYMYATKKKSGEVKVVIGKKRKHEEDTAKVKKRNLGKTEYPSHLLEDTFIDNSDDPTEWEIVCLIVEAFLLDSKHLHYPRIGAETAKEKMFQMPREKLLKRVIRVIKQDRKVLWEEISTTVDGQTSTRWKLNSDLIVNAANHVKVNRGEKSKDLTDSQIKRVRATVAEAEKYLNECRS
jgi:hypothetical protein